MVVTVQISPQPLIMNEYLLIHPFSWGVIMSTAIWEISDVKAYSHALYYFFLFCFLKKKKCLKLESSSVLKCKDNYTNTVIVNSCMVCFSQWRGRDATTNEHPQLLSTFLDVRAWNTGDGAEWLLGFSHFFIHFCSSCSTEGLNFHCSFSSWSQFEDAVEISPHSKAGSGLVRRPNTSFQKWSWLGY